MKLYMSPREIEYDYIHAANKRKQINILAELNSTVPLKICHILYERNVLELSCTVAKQYAVMRMLNDGRSTDYINRKLNISVERIESIKKGLAGNAWIFGKAQKKPCSGVSKRMDDVFDKIREIQKS